MDRVDDVGFGDPCRREDVADAAFQTLPGELDRIVEGDAELAADDLAERPVRDPVPGREAPSTDDAKVGPRLHGVAGELPNEPALTDARRAEHHDESKRPGFDSVVERLGQAPSLALPTDDRRLQASRRGFGLEARPEDGPRLDRLGLASKLEIPRVAEAIQIRHGSVGSITHEDGRRLGSLFEPRRDVHGIADDDHLAFGTANRSHDVARIDPDPDLEGHAEALMKIDVQTLESRDHLQGRPDGAARVILVGHRDAEDGHDRVADVLLDRPAPAVDDAGHRREVGPEKRLQALGVEALSQVRRADQIREEDRDELALVRPSRRRAACHDP